MSALLTAGAADATPRDLSFLWLEITAKCNLECAHCYADSGPRGELFGQMSTDDWLSVLRDAADVGCRHVQFIGGEPTLHPDLSRMISFASARGYTFIEVFTNATAISEALLHTFVGHNVHVATSFYSDDPETHDAVTKHRGSFDRTVSNIRRLLAAGLHVRAGVIETQGNAGHAERAKRFLEGLGVSEIRVDFQRGVGRGAQPLHSLDPMAELCGECWKGKLCVTPSGRSYPCVFSRFADVGQAKEGLRKVLKDDALLEFRHRLKKYRSRKDLKNTALAGADEAGVDATTLAMGACGPDVICNPDLTCPPNCGPHSSSCGPTQFCVPARICPPEMSCNPTTGPCAPEHNCAPYSQG